MTYRELIERLHKLTPAQLDQTVQVMPHEPDTDEIVELVPVYFVGTVGETDHENTKSDVDNEHHPEQVVICTDYHSFDEDGDSILEMTDQGWVGYPSGKPKPWPW